MIRGEIEYTREPFPEVMLEISSRIKEPYASLFVQAHRVFEEQGSLKFPEWFREYASRRHIERKSICPQRSGKYFFPLGARPDIWILRCRRGC